MALESNILLFSLDTLRPMMQLDGHTGPVTSLLFPAHSPIHPLAKAPNGTAATYQLELSTH